MEMNVKENLINFQVEKLSFAVCSKQKILSQDEGIERKSSGMWATSVNKSTSGTVQNIVAWKLTANRKH